MRHTGFLRELNRLPQSHPDWETLSVCYRAVVMLDFIDEERVGPRAHSHIDVPPAPDDWRAQALHTAVVAMVGAVMEYRPDDSPSREQVLRAMEQALEEAKLSCYVDATTDLANTLVRFEADSPTASTWRALTARAAVQLWRGRTDDAVESYQEALVAATEIADPVGIIRCTANLAKSRGMRGNLPAAEEELRGLMERANSAGMAPEEALMAAHLGMVVGMRGRAREALEILEYAAERTVDINPREGAAVNIALTRAILGDAEGATKLLERFIAEGRSASHVAVSRGHLMELYAKSGRRADIDELLRATHLETLPQHPRAYVEVSAGRAFKILGDTNASARWLTAALADAEASDLGSLVFEIEEELDGLLGKSWRKHRSTPMTAAAPVPLNLPPVARPAVQAPQLDTSKQEAGTPTR